MDKWDDDRLLDFFVKAFTEVVVPILEDHGKKLDEHGKQLEVLNQKIDAHTASLVELEKLPKLVGDVYNEVKDMRVQIRGHEERITKLESVNHL